MAIRFVLDPVLDDTLRPVTILDAAGQPLTFTLLLVAAAAADPSGPTRDFLAWAQSPAGQAVVAQRHLALEP